MEVGWLLFELTVTWLGWRLVALTKSPDRRGEGRSQMVGWGPKTEVAPFSPSAKKTRRNVSYWKGLVADRPIAKYSGWRRQKKYLRTRGTQVLQASIKNSIKSISLWKKDSPVEPRRKIRWVTLGPFLLYTQTLYTTLSLSLSLNLKENERTEKKDIYAHGLFNSLYIFDTLKVYLFVQ